MDDAFPPEAVRLAYFGTFKLKRFIRQSGIMSGTFCGDYARDHWRLERDLLLLQDTLTQLTKALATWGTTQRDTTENGAAIPGATLPPGPEVQGIVPSFGEQTLRTLTGRIVDLSKQAGKKMLHSMTGDRAEVINHLRCLDIILDGLLNGVDTAAASLRLEAWEVEVLEDSTAQRLQKILGQCNHLFKETVMQRNLSKRLSGEESLGDDVPAAAVAADTATSHLEYDGGPETPQNCIKPSNPKTMGERCWFAQLSVGDLPEDWIPVLVERKTLPGVPPWLLPANQNATSRTQIPSADNEILRPHSISRDRLELLSHLLHDAARLYGDAPALDICGRLITPNTAKNQTTYDILYKLPTTPQIGKADFFGLLPDRPTTLEAVIARGLETPLDARLELAYSIFRFVFKYHKMGWVDKHLQPSNILLLPTKDSPAHLSLRAFAIGFDYARGMDSRAQKDMSEKFQQQQRIKATMTTTANPIPPSGNGSSNSSRNSQFFEASPYSHPDYQPADATSSFHPRYDLFSLGVMFWEIARWKPD